MHTLVTRKPRTPEKIKGSGFVCFYYTIFPVPRHTEYCVENNEIHAVFLVVLVKNDKNHSFMAEF